MPEEAQEQDDGDIGSTFREDMSLRVTKASFTSNKGALTRLSNQVKVHAETFVAIKSQDLHPSSTNHTRFSPSASSCTVRLTSRPWPTR